MRAARPVAGRVALVTGAAGGIGRELARRLATDGARVALADLDQAAVDAVAEELPAGVIARALDVTDADAYAALMDEVEATLGPLDILCNVAGVMPLGPFDEEDRATTEQTIAVNLLAVMQSTKEAARRMRPRNDGHIVNVASGGGWVAAGGGATYSASKFGVVGYSESVALELRGTGVEISVIAPAIVKTALAAGLQRVRGLPELEPETVADAIVQALERPRFAVFVPRRMGVMALAFSGMPHGIRHRISRAMRADRLLLHADMRARETYENHTFDPTTHSGK